MEQLASIILTCVLLGAIYYFLWVLSADPRPPFEPAKWYVILPISILCLIPLLMYADGTDGQNPIFNFLLAFGLSSIITPLLFGNIKLEFFYGWLDKITISLLRSGFVLVFGWLIIYFESPNWVLTLSGIALASYITRAGFYFMFKEGPGLFFKSIACFIFILFFYFQAVENSALTPENWHQAFSQLSGEDDA